MAKKHRFDARKFFVEPKEKLNLSKRSTRAGKELEDKAEGHEMLAADVSALQSAQNCLYASDSHALLIILQGMDAAGKDSTIRHVMGGVNPQGCRVYSFRAPNATEQQHHFLWRPVPCLPQRGMISIFNRSYYEEVLAVRVHPEFLIPQKLPSLNGLKEKSLQRLWKQRFKEIRNFEQTLVNNGTSILKFFLHVSRDEQKKRFLERLTDPEKYWKFNHGDLAERKLWREYQDAIEDALPNTSTEAAPWYAIPIDDKWYAQAAIADIIAAKLEEMDIAYPTVPNEELQSFQAFIDQLEKE